jgi:hypothetical protein
MTTSSADFINHLRLMKLTEVEGEEEEDFRVEARPPQVNYEYFFVGCGVGKQSLSEVVQMEEQDISHMHLSLVYITKIYQLSKSINKTKLTSLISKNKITNKAINRVMNGKSTFLQIDLSPQMTVNAFTFIKLPSKQELCCDKLRHQWQPALLSSALETI